MNPVYGFISGRARGLFSLSIAERVVIASASLGIGWLCGALFGLLAAVGGLFAMRALSRLQHGRSDHLDTVWRRWMRTRTMRLLDHDLRWRPFES